MVFITSFCAKCFAVQIILNNFEVLFQSIVDYRMNKNDIITSKASHRKLMLEPYLSSLHPPKCKSSLYQYTNLFKMSEFQL